MTRFPVVSTSWLPKVRQVARALRAPLMIALALCLFNAVVFAQGGGSTASETPEPAPFVANTGDTAWVLASAALVLFMTPGLAFFYGGLVRSKNMLNTLMMSFAAMAVMAMVWVFAGYSIAFGNNGNPYHGGLGWAGLPPAMELFTDNYPVAVDSAGKPIQLTPTVDAYGKDIPTADQKPIDIELFATVPHGAFMIFQMMFFIITPALISGSLVERMKFVPYLIFIALWGLLVYCPVAHWVWHPAGWIFTKGAMDFAGGAVVHVNAGFAALAGALVVGQRKGYRTRPMLPHSLPLCLLGVGILWFGWYGFNAGSAGGAGALGVMAFVNTTVGAAAAMFTWMILDLITKKEITALGAGTGAVAGLVGITPACGFVTPGGAILVGAITSCVCYVMATVRAKNKVDDSLDAFAVHGVGGFTGAVLTGIFASGSLVGVNAFIVPGGLETVWKQIYCTTAVAIYSFVMAFIILSVIKAMGGLRVSDEAEERGLDLSLHGEDAYASESSA
ncbi:MAG TPA: ammonium transporter [Abditibacterium sp.]